MKSNPQTAVAQPEIPGARSMPVTTSPSSWVEVSVAALRHNLWTIQSHVKSEVIVCPVIKSDAYGHGAIGCALALRDAGVKWLAVSTVEEGVMLRRKGFQERVLVLSGFWPGEEDEIVRHDLTPAIWERSHVELLETAVRKLKPQGRASIHLKVNTGMNRLGADMASLQPIFETVLRSPQVFMEGIFSHYASSEIVELPDGDEQLQGFRKAVVQAEAMGIRPPIRHMANSAAIVSRPQSWFNLVRPGLAVYGYCLPLTCAAASGSTASGSTASGSTLGKTAMPEQLPLLPALTWKARVLQVRDVAAGEQVGYSRGHIAQHPTRVAVLTVGYGDGLSRRLSARGRVIVRDAYAAILGNVSMNLTAVDVTRIAGVEAGDEVTIIGSSPSCSITALDHAELVSTVPYEILCNIAGRLPRKYVE